MRWLAGSGCSGGRSGGGDALSLPLARASAAGPSGEPLLGERFKTPCCESSALTVAGDEEPPVACWWMLVRCRFSAPAGAEKLDACDARTRAELSHVGFRQAASWLVPSCVVAGLLEGTAVWTAWGMPSAVEVRSWYSSTWLTLSDSPESPSGLRKHQYLQTSSNS